MRILSRCSYGDHSLLLILNRRARPADIFYNKRTSTDSEDMTAAVGRTLAVAFCVCAAARCPSPAHGERILAIAPIAGQSHWNFMKGVLRALTDRGHHVTVFTAIPDGDRENYTEVDVSKDVGSLVRLNISDVHELLAGYAALIDFVHHYSRNTFAAVHENRAARAIVAGPRPRFDAIVVEFMASEWVSCLAAELGLPLIYVTPPPLISYAEHTIAGHYAHPAVVSHTLADHSVPRTFVQRFANTALLVYTSCLLRYKSWSAGLVDPRPYDRIEPVKPSIVFSNSHHVIDPPRFLPANVIPVGGIHLAPPKRVHHDILEFVENSPRGVILFTLGSVVAMSSLPKRTREAIIKSLGRVPQRVLLKYEDDIAHVPDNVMIRKWFPQRDILLHPNVKLFISHGGISGVYEAVDAGVPVLGFPVFYDQRRNLASLVDAGMAVLLDLETITEDTFSRAISELVDDRKYAENAKLASDRFKDRPVSLGRTVDYWTRYAIRHRDAPGLKSHAHGLAWYQYFLLDVIAVTSLALSLVVYVTRKATKTLYGYCVPGRQLEPV